MPPVAVEPDGAVIVAGPRHRRHGFPKADGTLELLAKERGDLTFKQQVLFYPVTDASFDTASYQEFAQGYFLQGDGMKWFWDAYTGNLAHRTEVYASPLRASLEQLQGLPTTLVITDEADWSEFERLAGAIRARFDAQIVERLDGLDERYWDLEVADQTVTLHLGRATK